MSCCLLKHRYTATYSRDTTTDICLHSFFTRRSHPATFPHTPSFRCPPYRQQATCLPVRKRATRGRLRSSTHPNLDAHEPGRARSRSRDSRRGEPPVAGSGDETENGAPYLHPFPPTKRVDSPVRADKKTDQPPPDSGASRRQLSPGPGEHHQLPPPALYRAPPPPPGLSALDRPPPQELPGPGRPCRPLGLDIHGGAGPAGARRRQPDDTTPTYRFDEDIEQAKPTARETSLVAKRAQQALAQSVAAAAAGATAAPLPSSRPQGVASQRPRPGHGAFINGIVACMSSAPRVDFSSALATAVGETACTLLPSERPASRQADVLSGSGQGLRGLYALC